MKIQPVKPIEPIEPITKAKKSSETGRDRVVVDHLEISSESTSMSVVYQTISKEDKAQEEARREEIEVLKKKIEEGIYEVNENMMNVILASIIGYTA